MLKTLLYPLLISSILLTGCVDRTIVRFQVSPGLELRTKIEVDENPGHSVLRLELERPVIVQNPRNAVILEFTPSFEQADLTLTMGGSALFIESLDSRFVNADPAGTVSFSIPVEVGVRFDGLVLDLPGREGEFSAAELLSAGFGEEVAGVVFGPSPEIDTRVGVSIHRGNPHSRVIFDISRLSMRYEGIAAISLEYTYTPDQNRPDRVSLVAGSPGNSTVFDLRLREGDGAVYLYEGVCGFVPGFVEFHIEGGGFGITSLSVDEIPRDDGAGIVPIPIDMGGVIGYSRDQWRDDEFEIFSWNLYPEILIIDTISYTVQSDFFKRLAFFVEKAGSAGRLLPDRELEGKHGWNAHDYLAEDLARFFSLAEEEAFILGDKELILREMLAANKVIRRENGQWLPGNGGLISLSQESSPRLRELFMIHEGYHGVFFSDADYRELCFSVWQGLSLTEQWFWREFLQLREYNSRDDFLVVNEFQAYLMQVLPERLEAYYWDYTVPGLVAAVPRTAPVIEELKLRYPDTFHRSAEALEAYLLEAAGIGAADLFCLQSRE